MTAQSVRVMLMPGIVCLNDERPSPNTTPSSNAKRLAASRMQSRTPNLVVTSANDDSYGYGKEEEESGIVATPTTLP
jgi:hypothetical protein